MRVEDNLELFKKHIADIVVQEQYKDWKLIDENDLSKGIYSTTTWRDGKTRVTEITFNIGYPEFPPTIKVIPKPNNPCFDNEGYLHFAEFKSRLVWNRYKDHVNPMVYLIDELYSKYGLDMFFDLD
jgi:ubiquitin-protein ligase